jgi:hypothetical protein
MMDVLRKRLEGAWDELNKDLFTMDLVEQCWSDSWIRWQALKSQWQFVILLSGMWIDIHGTGTTCVYAVTGVLPLRANI